MASNDADSDESAGAPDREHMLLLLNEAIDEAHEKAVNGRVYNAENEKVRQGWLRVLGYLTGQFRQLKKDQKMEEIEERLAQLEQRDGETDL